MTKKLSLYLYAFLIIALTSTTAFADKIDDYVKRQMTEKHIPGVAIAVIENGRVKKMKAYGLANVELNVPVTKETVFEIGSVSKQMTAAAIMILAREGKINVDEKISKYLPDTPENWSSVTVRHLLTHTSGIKSYTGLTGYELTKRLKRDDFIKQLAKEPLDFPTGDRYRYSNSGYNLLGFIIEAVSGKTYWEFMRERIFQPLAMRSTTDRDPLQLVKNRADGYDFKDGKLIGRDYDLTDIFAAGAIVSTIEDLARWEAALSKDSFLNAKEKQELWTPVRLNDGTIYNYGLGWRLSEINSHKIIGHSGQTAGFTSDISRYTDDKLTIIVLTNLNPSGLATEINRGIARLFIPEIKTEKKGV